MPDTFIETATADAFDPRAFRDALGHYASGITIVTGRGQTDEPVGFTCQSFYSVSLEPPLVSFCVRRESNSWPKIRPSGHFAVNVLHWDQVALSNSFARSSGDRWAGVDWAPNAEGSPMIRDTLLTLECRFYAEHEAGDHLIVIGEVMRFVDEAKEHTASPLVYYKGRYHQVSA
ncbi:flavin reductase family protein [Pseudooceanicola sp. CBS1P-1]|uniref:Flavin reductase n=1 Tax=Pseudooceanicola albus TaxID=2692189 RepID=A0A6L7GBH9_9RHOB|nr:MULTISPECIES: flavin reductase family protein [Pseudooceanicola]MBT9386580.1 flavin reductase family protein [Pseudooceanicola endophyticus]MXN20696.1 flavin reductase [Pseudooceanicola albus]